MLRLVTGWVDIRGLYGPLCVVTCVCELSFHFFKTEEKDGNRGAFERRIFCYGTALTWRRSRAKSSGREYERIRTMNWVLFFFIYLFGLGHRANTNISGVVTDPAVQLRFQDMLP